MDVIMQENNKSNVRQKKAYLFCLIGMAVDAVLGLLKIWMGWQSGSIAVIGDGFNNVTDAGSVFLLLLTFYYAAKPSDRTHPFGHGRLEYLNSTIMASAVLYVGISLLCNSAEKIMDPEPIEFSGLLACIQKSAERDGFAGLQRLRRGFTFRCTFHRRRSYRCGGGKNDGIPY